MAGVIDVQEFLRGFLDEADEHLRRITANLVVVEASPERAHPQALAELMRSLHTLKGLAGMMELAPLVALAHAMESLVRTAERDGASVPAAALDPLVTGAAALAERVRALAEGTPMAAAPEALLSTLERLASAPPSRAAAPRAPAPSGLDPGIAAKLAPGELEELQQALERGDGVLQVTFAPSPARADAGHTITSVRAAIEPLGRIVRVLPRSVPAGEAAPGGLVFVLLVVTGASPPALAEAAGLGVGDVVALASGTRPAPAEGVAAVTAGPASEDEALARASRRGVVRMHVAKLDAALEQLSALAVGQRQLRGQARALTDAGLDVRGLWPPLEEQERRIRRLRSTLLELRMVPLHEVLEPLPLIVRGLRNATGKDVRLVVDVGEAELDKTVAERLFPALVHVVRNAIDHGIEDAATRRACGKPEAGVVRVDAAPGASMLEITIADDGAGIDVGRVAARAGRAAPRTDAALLEILASPGFSTRDAATTTSGRGVGLDVVRRTIETLGGTLELHNRPGRGTTLRIRAPLTVAILDALAFVAGRERYLAPLATVDAVVELEPSQVVRPPGRDDGRAPSLLHVRGDLVPLVSLRGALGLPRADDETKALLVRRHGQPFALGVARMLGAQEVLVRPLVDPLVAVQGVAGAADLGDGRPTLVLDLPALVSASLAERPARPAEVHR